MKDQFNNFLKRNLLRYSLRTALLLLTIACITLGWLANEVYVQRDAVAWVKENGGRVTYSSLHNPFGEKYPPPGPTWLRNIVGIDFLDHVTVVHIENSLVSDISKISKLDRLTTLSLYDANVQDLSPLSNLKELDYLYLGNLPSTNLIDIQGCTKLQSLGIKNCQFKELPENFSLPSLQSLYLDETKLVNISALENCPNLEEIRIYGSNIDTQSIIELTNNSPNLFIQDSDNSHYSRHLNNERNQ